MIFDEAAIVPPDGQLTLAFYGPTAVDSDQTFSVEAVAQNVPSPGLYGVQFEIHYDPSLVSVVSGSLQVNPDLSFVVIEEVTIAPA